MEYAGQNSKGRFYLEHKPGDVEYFGHWDQCSSDVKIWLKSGSGEWTRRHPFPHRGKGGRYDLCCNVGGWPRDVQFARVIGWCFMARKNMSFDEYQSKELVSWKGGKKYYAYKYQVNHIGGNPENCCLDHLELGDSEYNKDQYSVEAAELRHTVFKRPACKRPAARTKR